jgi:ATP-dependent DNA ligase
MAREMWAAGLEGIVLKDAEAPYRRNRNAAWQKIGRPWQQKLGLRIAA